MLLDGLSPGLLSYAWVKEALTAMTFQPDQTQAIDDVKGQLSLWREFNKTPKRIPREIWTQGIELATIHFEVSRFSLRRSRGAD